MAAEINEIRYLTALRVFACFAVVVLHTTMNFVTKIQNTHGVSWWIGNVVDSSVRWCIPAFVLISGALLLDPAKVESTRIFFTKRANRLIIPLIFWSIFYFVARAFLDPRGFTVNIIIHDLIYGIPFHHLWYLYMILGIFLFTPALRAYVKCSGSTDRLITLVTIFVISAIYSLFIGLPKIIIALFLPYLGYFIAGYHLRFMAPTKISNKYLVIAIFVAITITALGTGLLVDKLGKDKGFLLYDYLSPMVMIAAIAIFILFKRMESIFRTNKRIYTIMDKLSPATLGIYLIHPIIIIGLYKLGGIGTILSFPLISIPAISILTFLISSLLILIVIKIPYLRRTVL